MTPEELALKIQTGEADQADQEALFGLVRRYCMKIALQYRGELRDPTDEMQDLSQESFLATIHAAKDYDPEKGAKFLTWLNFYLRSYFDSYLSRQIGRSGQHSVTRHRIRKYESEFYVKNGRNPTDEELCHRFHLSPERLNFLRYAGREESLNQENEDGSLEELERLSDPSDMESEICDRLVMEEVRAIIKRYLRDLPKDEREVIVLFYYKGKTLKEASKILGLAENEFRNKLNAGIRKLRHYKVLSELGRYLPERVTSIAYRRPNKNRWQSSTELAAMRAMDLEQMENAKDIRTGMHYKKEM